MTNNQILLIQMMTGNVLSAILSKVAAMSPKEVEDATRIEENRSDSLLEEMRSS